MKFTTLLMIAICLLVNIFSIESRRGNRNPRRRRRAFDNDEVRKTNKAKTDAARAKKLAAARAYAAELEAQKNPPKKQQSSSSTSTYTGNSGMDYNVNAYSEY